MADTHCIAEPLSDVERTVLRAYVEGDAAFLTGRGVGVRRGEGDEWATVVRGAADSLKARGFLQSHERGVLVTPEGVAAALN